MIPSVHIAPNIGLTLTQFGCSLSLN